MSCAELQASGKPCPEHFRNCSSCPATCQFCDTCYRVSSHRTMKRTYTIPELTTECMQDGGNYYYATEEPHPGALGHPNNYHDSMDPFRVQGDPTGCKQAYAYCTIHGYQQCSNEGACFNIPVANDNPLSTSDAQLLAGSEIWDEDTGSCQCIVWYRRCMIMRNPE